MRTKARWQHLPGILATVLLTACGTPHQSAPRHETVPPDQLPPLVRHSIDHFPKGPLLWRNPTFSIKLELGARRRDPDTGMFRTGSRYQLTNIGNVMSAESVLAIADRSDTDSDLSPAIHLFHDPDNASWLIHEEHSWSVDRITLFQAGASGNRLRYLRTPRLPGGLPHLREYRIRGMHHGTLYIEKAGLIYALPIDRLADEETLAYGIG